LLNVALIIVVLPHGPTRVICAHIITFVAQLALERRFGHGNLVVIVVVVLGRWWSTVHGSCRRSGLVAVSIVMLRGWWWSGRSRVLVTLITIPLLLPVWLSVVVQSLCGVLGEMIGIVRLGRLANVLALEAKVKVVDIVVDGRLLAQVRLRFGRLQLARGSLIAWLELGGLRRAVQLHVVQMLFDRGLTLVSSGSVEIGHGGLYLVLTIHGLGRLMVIVVVDASQAFVLVGMVTPGLLRMSEIVLVSRSVGKVGCLRYACFVGNVGDRNDGRTMTCGYTAQQRRLQSMRVASDLSIKRSEEGALTAVGRVARRRARRGRIGRAEGRERSELCWRLLWSGMVGMALVSGLWTGISTSRRWILRVGVRRVMGLRRGVWKRMGWIVVAELWYRVRRALEARVWRRARCIGCRGSWLRSVRGWWMRSIRGWQTIGLGVGRPWTWVGS
jgi:hypothetical protein